MLAPRARPAIVGKSQGNPEFFRLGPRWPSRHVSLAARPKISAFPRPAKPYYGETLILSQAQASPGKPLSAEQIRSALEPLRGQKVPIPDLTQTRVRETTTMSRVHREPIYEINCRCLPCFLHRVGAPRSCAAGGHCASHMRSWDRGPGRRAGAARGQSQPCQPHPSRGLRAAEPGLLLGGVRRSGKPERAAGAQGRRNAVPHEGVDVRANQGGPRCPSLDPEEVG